MVKSIGGLEELMIVLLTPVMLPLLPDVPAVPGTVPAPPVVELGVSEFFDEIVECELPEQLEVTLDAGDADEDDDDNNDDDDETADDNSLVAAAPFN